MYTHKSILHKFSFFFLFFLLSSVNFLSLISLSRLDSIQFNLDQISPHTHKNSKLNNLTSVYKYKCLLSSTGGGGKRE